MKKSLLKIALSALLVAVVLVGGTLAYLVTQTGVLTNTFAVANIDTEVEETPESGTAEQKAPVIKNLETSNVPVYVRAIAVVSTDKDSPVAVSSSNVTFTYAAGWQKYGDYYYYMQALDPGKSTTELFNGVTVSGLDGTARFSVYVYHESVQAKDTTLTDVSKIAALFD
ncbi:hypothetical protein H6B33_00635 [Gemmiger formicilis]|uniref:hypothetical protein n=1 Tax=Gemmiger formicilis TaxID=745368 RepID=UPI00195A39F9|nr:hypothetical protein [Gemmiger formicilis]MBM6913909.1 hypothetical protein [Gemmiger formicilis]